MRAEADVQGQGADVRNARNLVDLVLIQGRVNASRPAAVHKRNGRWEETSWGAVLEEVRKLSAGIVSLGVKPGDKVAIFAATSLQWMITDLAVSGAGAVTIPIYASNTPDECRYILNNSEATLLFVDHDLQEGKQAGRASRIRQ